MMCFMIYMFCGSIQIFSLFFLVTGITSPITAIIKSGDGTLRRCPSREHHVHLLGMTPPVLAPCSAMATHAWLTRPALCVQRSQWTRPVPSWSARYHGCCIAWSTSRSCCSWGGG
jgi:hypothetical protein